MGRLVIDLDNFTAVHRGPGTSTPLPALQAPGQVTGVAASPSATSAAVSWSLTANATSYKVDWTPVAGSGEQSSMPVGNLTGWTQVLAEDFTTPVPLGSFNDAYPGWNGYDGARDTSKNYGRVLAKQGLYDSDATCSVHDSMLDIYVHTPADGTPRIAAPLPRPTSAAFNQLYGRYAVRFRSDVVQGYKVAWLLWPQSDDWAEGEIDFPETSLGGTIEGFSHQVDGDPAVNQWHVDTGEVMTEWHVAVIEWTPTVLRFKLDDLSWQTTDTDAIPHTPMRWTLQTETLLSSTPPPTNAAGHVYIDWVAAWSYNP